MQSKVMYPKYIHTMKNKYAPALAQKMSFVASTIKAKIDKLSVWQKISLKVVNFFKIAEIFTTAWNIKTAKVQYSFECK